MFQPRRSYTLVGIDPGATTGLFAFHYRYHDGGGYGRPSEHVNIGAQQVPAADVWQYLWGHIDHWEEEDQGPECGYIHIAVEKYIITARTAKLSQQHDALEVTGAVKAAAAASYSKPEVHQYLKANLRFASDEMLKAVGWSTPGQRHANDAARQAFALLKDLDYPRWSALVAGATLEPEDEGRTIQ